LAPNWTSAVRQVAEPVSSFVYRSFHEPVKCFYTTGLTNSFEEGCTPTRKASDVQLARKERVGAYHGVICGARLCAKRCASTSPHLASSSAN
jgi:hypothetical protein